MTRSVSKFIQRFRELGLFGVIRNITLRINTTLIILHQRCTYLRKVVQSKTVSWDSIDGQLMENFLSTTIQDQERYSELFSYLVFGLNNYRAQDNSHIYYPGASSIHGAEIDAIEGFCRILPMISSWIYSGRPLVIDSYVGQHIDLLNIVRKGLLEGTNPNSKGFWGNITDDDQRIVEAADIALSVWLLRDHLWPQFTSIEKDMISKWLLSVNAKRIPDNNWQIFPIMVNEVLSSLGYPTDQVLSLMHYTKLKSYYIGNGWFSDGPGGEIDFYNAWGIHYALFWINLINPKLDPVFIDYCLDVFVRNYKYIFSTDGIPITGRSVCYRMATPSPLIAAATKGMASISSGMARRALDSVWKYFIKNGALNQGRITQGYWQEDLMLLDNYSGPGSSMWSTRSLTIAFFNTPDSKFWTEPQQDLPIEICDYTISIPEIQWVINGYKLTREIQLFKENNIGNIHKDEVTISPLMKIVIYFLGLPYRINDEYNKNKLHMYSSLNPFWVKDSLNLHVGNENE